MNILLTGGLGFIGKNFILHRPKNWRVTSLDFIEDKKFLSGVINTDFYKVNLTYKKDVKRLAAKLNQKFDACLFLAANGDPALSVSDPLWDLQMTTETLINVATNFDITKFVYLSSGAVYDGNQKLVMPKTTIQPKLPYAISHLASEEYTRFFQKSGKVKDYVVIRFFGAYGPYEPKRKIYSNLVKAFAICKEKEFILRGDGNNLIDAMYIQDAIEGLIKVIKSKKTNITMDFCKGEHLSITNLVQKAAQIFNIEVRIKYRGSVPEYNNFYASSGEFEKVFDFKPKISLRKGLKKLYEFYQE